MRILDKSEVYEIEKNKENNVTIFTLVDQCHKEGVITEKRFNEVNDSLNATYKLRHNLAGIDKNFKEIFSVQGAGKIANFANYMGADMAGLEADGSKVLCTNVEMGINFTVVNAQKEKIEDYLTLVDLIAQGLKNPDTFKTVFNANETKSEVKNDTSKTYKM